MKILSGTQMARLDRLSIRRHGISALGLMHRAAEACCLEIAGLKGWKRRNRVVILCGPGNNGGDGLAIASILRGQGRAPEVFFFGKEDKLSPEARHFFQKAKDLILPTRRMNASLRRADLIVDALFGLGLKRPLIGKFAAAILAMNRARGFKLAVDMPSGISADSGEVLGTAFRADLTVTFEAPKWGQILPPAWDFVGRLAIWPIGLSRAELSKMPSLAEWVDADLVRKFHKPRPLGANKGKGGRVLVLAGSKEMPGAGYLTALGALRAGAGLVTWALPEEAYRKLDLRYPEVMLMPLASKDGQFRIEAIPVLRAGAKKFQTCALGPGLGQGEGLRRFLLRLLPPLRLPKVIDADGLNNLAAGKIPGTLLRGAVITPHWLEMSRLTRIPLPKIKSDPIAAAQRFARRHRCWVVLKGYRSVIAGPSGRIWINSSGGPNLATGGSGDVLTGVIAGFLAQGWKTEGAVLTGVFLHGLAGDRLANQHGDRGSLASEVAKMIPKVRNETIEKVGNTRKK